MLEMEIIEGEDSVNEDTQIVLSQCRFCFEETEQEDLFTPCMCSGTAKFVHRHCLQEWRSQDIDSINYTRCQECLFDYEMRNQISKFQMKWIRICKVLSANYFFIFLFILSINIGYYFLFLKYDNGEIHNFLHLSANKQQEYMFLSTILTTVPLFLIILLHDIYVYFKYRLHTYFNNYAGMGCRSLVIWICICFFILAIIYPYIGWICLSILFQKIFKHMLDRHYSMHITNTTFIVDQRDDDELHINII